MAKAKATRARTTPGRTGKTAAPRKAKTAATKRDNKRDNIAIWQDIVTRAWKDRTFRDRLLQDPDAVLTEHGFKRAKGRSYRVVADSKDTKHLILPESARRVRVKPVRGSEPDPGF